VRFHRTGVKRLHHPVVGDLELSYEGLDLPADPGWHLYTFTAAPGTPSDERLRLLANWAATLEHANTGSRSVSADASTLLNLDEGLKDVTFTEVSSRQS
jgi:nitric oxide synthase oxygenase domain/subunit